MTWSHLASAGAETDSEVSEIAKVLRALNLDEESATLSEEPNPPFNPTEAILFLGNRCNLRCVYCYASAGSSSPRVLSRRIGEAAIDAIIENALAYDTGEVFLGFHGGGEPTFEWNRLVHLTGYCKTKASAQGLAAHVAIATNGLLPGKRARWIAENLTSANLSLDGTKPYHDLQRPAIGDKASFDVILRTAKIFDANDFRYGIRCTVTDQNVEHLGEFAELVRTLTSCVRLHLEPLFPVGRGETSFCRPPDSMAFVEAFREVVALTASAPLEVVYSGARPDVLTDCFCRAEKGIFCVTSEGDVTSCFEITERNHPLAEDFRVGEFDGEQGCFRFNPKAVVALKSLKDGLCADCRQCFCRFHCAGDCAVRAMSGDQDSRKRRCEITRELTKDRLVASQEALLAKGSRCVGNRSLC